VTGILNTSKFLQTTFGAFMHFVEKQFSACNRQHWADHQITRRTRRPVTCKEKGALITQRHTFQNFRFRKRNGIQTNQAKSRLVQVRWHTATTNDKE